MYTRSRRGHVLCKQHVGWLTPYANLVAPSLPDHVCSQPYSTRLRAVIQRSVVRGTPVGRAGHASDTQWGTQALWSSSGCQRLESSAVVSSALVPSLFLFLFDM